MSELLAKKEKLMNIALSTLQQRIINGFQKSFPLCSAPFQQVAGELNCDESEVTETEVINAIEELNNHNILSRLGPVFDHKKAGASTLAAIAVPEEQLDEIASIVNQFEQVNHNYAREHHYNLWFVVTAKDLVALNKALTDIDKSTGFKVLVLPMEASYHIDLSFNINFSNSDENENKLKGVNKPQSVLVESKTKPLLVDTLVKSSEKLTLAQQLSLRTILEKGLPLVAMPYHQIANQMNIEYSQVIAQISLWQQEGLIKRFGLVVKHRQLGYIANAMVVWNIADKDVDAVAGRLSKRDEISLCYRRPRRLPEWPYNLFCMIHGKSRTEVELQIKTITQELALVSTEKDVLFSYKAYKQNGARYQTVDKNIANELQKESR